MLNLDRNTKALARRASFFSLAMAAVILAPIACSNGASAREGGNGGGGGGGAGGGGDNGGGNSLNYGNVPDVAITAAPSSNQRQGRGHGIPLSKAGSCIGDRLSCGVRS